MKIEIEKLEEINKLLKEQKTKPDCIYLSEMGDISFTWKNKNE